MEAIQIELNNRLARIEAMTRKAYEERVSGDYGACASSLAMIAKQCEFSNFERHMLNEASVKDAPVNEAPNKV